MNGLAQAERDFDRRLPAEGYLVDTSEYDAERDYRPRVAFITDADVEKFIADLVAAPDKNLFLEETVGTLPGADFNLHIAVAKQWVKDVKAHGCANVGDLIGPAFWKWAKHCASEAAK